ncbi:MAG: hypothetical protein AAF293_06215 [Pseudomonadota bacterium]
MSIENEDSSPEAIADNDMDQAKGGYSVWIGGSVKDEKSGKVVMSGGSTMIKGPEAKGMERVFDDE